jgi:hypothetical protein
LTWPWCKERDAQEDTPGREKSLKFSVAVTTKFSGHLAGTVTIKAGKKRICAVKISSAGEGDLFPVLRDAFGRRNLFGQGVLRRNSELPAVRVQGREADRHEEEVDRAHERRAAAPTRRSSPSPHRRQSVKAVNHHVLEEHHDQAEPRRDRGHRGEPPAAELSRAPRGPAVERQQCNGDRYARGRRSRRRGTG